MKRLILVLALTGASWAQGGIISGTVFNPNGKPVPGALIAVGTLASSGIPLSPRANIYTDQTLVTQMVTNTVTADSLGNYTIYVPSGYYHIQISGTGLTTSTYTVQAASAVATFAVQSSTDLGLSVQTCILRLPSTGGLCDASSITGSQTLSTVVQVNKPNVGIKWGQIQLSLCQPSASAFSWQANNLHMWGAGQGVTVFTNCVAGKNVLSSNFTLNSSLQGLEVNGISLVGGSGTSGVTALNGQDDAITVGNNTHAVSQVNIHDVECSGFALNCSHGINISHFIFDLNSHGMSEGARVCGGTDGKILGTYRDGNLINSVFTVVVGLDASGTCGGLPNADVDIQIQEQNWLDAEGIMVHNLNTGNIIAPQMDNVMFSIGLDNSTVSDVVKNIVISSPNIKGSATATGFPTNPAPANDCIFIGDSSGSNLTTDISVIGGELSNCNKVNQGDFAGGLVIVSADKVTVQGVTIHDSVGAGISLASSPSTRLNIQNNPVYNITASVANGGGGAVFPVGPVGGFADGFELAALAVGSTGRLQGNSFDHVVNCIDGQAAATGFLVGPNDCSNASATNINNPADFTENGQQANSTFANLPAFTNGTTIYCSDCKNVVDNAATAGAACAASGAGAWAKRENGRWDCN